MKKQLLIIALLMAGICSCSKEDDPAPAPATPAATTGKVTFYMGSQGGTWNLMVDGVDRGLLDETTQAPVCQDVDFITLELSIGTHTSDAKSNSGLAWGNPVSFNVAAGCNSYKVK